MPVYEYGVSETAYAVLNVVIAEYPESVFFSANTVLYTKFPSLSPSYVALTRISLNGSVLSSENEISNIQAGSNFTASIITNNAQALITKTSSVQTVDIFSMFECVPVPERDPNGSTTKSLTVPALEEYTVTYSAGSTPGVTNLPAAQTKIGQIDITLSDQTPVRTGYNFAGWNTAEDGTGVSYQVEGTYTADADVTLYAQWEPEKYAVNYRAVYWGNNPDKEQLTGSPWPANGYKLYGQTYTISNVVPSVSGFEFREWTTEDGIGSYNPGDPYSANEPLTLYAQWNAYAKPKITGNGTEIPLVVRSDSGGSQDLFGTYALVEFDWQTFASATGAAARLYYKLTSASTWTLAATISPLSGTSGSQSVVIGGGNLDVSKSYNVRIVVEDSTGNTTRFNTTLTMSYMTIDFGGEGKAIGIGTEAPDPTGHANGLMQIAMDAIDANGDPFNGSDRVIGTVTSNGWTCTKWASGKLECEQVGSSSVAFSASGTLYLGTITINLPSIIVSTSSKSIQCESNTYFIYGGGYFTGTTSVTYNVFRAASGTRTLTYIAKVIGTWK